MMVSGLVAGGLLVAPAVDEQIALQMAKAIAGQIPTRQAFGMVDATVDPDGRVTACDVASAKGERSITPHLCRWLRQTRLRQVAMIDGKPAYGRFRALMSFGPVRMGAVKAVARPDLVFSIRRFPDDRGEPYDIKLAALVSVTGVIERCEAQPEAVAAYAAMACAKVVGASRPVYRNDDGEAVPYVDAFTARFQAVQDEPKRTSK